MKIKVLFLIFLSAFSYAQNIPFSIDQLTESYVVENNKNLSSLLVLRTKKSSLAVRLDAENKVLDSLRIENSNKDYENLFAKTYDGTIAQFFWTDNAKKEYIRQTIDFNSKENTFANIFKISFKNQINIVEFSNNDTYYYVTLDKKTNIIHFHEFKNDGTYTDRQVDFSNEKFLSSDYKQLKFIDVATQYKGVDGASNFTFEYIIPEQVTAITFAASKRKAYLQNNTLVFTLDTNLNATDLIYFNLDDLSYIRKSISQPVLTFTYKMRSNSFLFEDHLYQFKLNDDGFILTVKDSNNNLKTSLGTMNDEEISYAIGKVKFQGVKKTEYKEFENTNKFMRKFRNMKGGLTVYNYKGANLLAIGAVSSEESGNKGAVIGAVAGGFVGAFVGALISEMSHSATMNNYDTYTKRNVMYFNTAFNKQFELVNIDIEELPLDKVNTFIKGQGKDLSHINLLFKNNAYYLGYASKKDDKYNWKVFPNL